MPVGWCVGLHFSSSKLSGREHGPFRNLRGPVCCYISAGCLFFKFLLETHASAWLLPAGEYRARVVATTAARSQVRPIFVSTLSPPPSPGLEPLPTMPLSAASLHRTRTCFTRRSPSAWRFMLGSMAPKAQLRHFSGGCPGHEAEPLHGKAAQARKKQQQLCKAASHEQQRMGDTRLGEVPLDGTQDSGVQQPVAFTHAANARRPTQWSHQPSNATKPARPTQSTSPKRRPRQRPQDYASERLPLPPYGALLPSTSPKHLDTSRVVLRLQQSRHWAVNQQMTVRVSLV